ncbi:MAG TPA: GAF domain-containing protein [Gaiellaceae bacterium]|nr:GAF domain-containing protein [Gaiellaceae bacterium]
MSESTQALLFNALPLLLLAAAYAVVTGAILPALWRGRRSAHPLDWAVTLVFPAIAAAAAIFGLLVVHDRRPIGGHLWASLAAEVVALAPALLLLSRWRERSFVAGGVGRSLEAAELVSARDRELQAVASLSGALVRARTLEDVAVPLVRHVTSVLGVGFAGAVVVTEAGETARGVYAELRGEPAVWWSTMDVDLRHEPSGIASAYHGAAPVVVYDVAPSPLVSARLAEQVGARSGAWIPMIADERVVGVLAVATTDEKRAFSPEDVGVLQALAGEAALAVDRLRSAAALSDALDREQAVAEIARRVRGELDPDEILRVAESELRRALQLDDVALAVDGDDVRVEAARAAPLSDGERFLVDTVAHEAASALRTARLLAENQRRLEQQAALLHAAQVVTSELDIDTVLQRLVGEVTNLLRADAADCYLLDAERGVLRCAAVHGFDSELVGFEFTPEHGVAAAALREVRPVAADEYASIGAPVPHPAYSGFTRAVVAPMVWGGETRGVLGVGLRDGTRTFSRADLELLEAFASLASLALRNAETFAERSRQARVQRGFYRIAALLGEPLSLDETYDAAAQAASEALGGDFAAVLVGGEEGLRVVGGHALPPRVRELEVPAALADAAADAQLIAATDVAADERFGPDWRSGPFASLLAIPVPGERTSVVLVFFERPHEFTHEDLELAQQVAGAARGALDRSRLFEAERTARGLSQQLARTGRLLATELDPAAVLEAVVEEAVALLRADAAALAALDGDELVVTAAVGHAADDAIGERVPASGTIAGDVLQSRAPVVRTQAPAEEARDEPLLAGGNRSYLGVPLSGREGGVDGVLAVYMQEPRAWREEEVQALVALAANASVALWNAELYQRVALEREQSVAILANIADGIVAVDRDGDVVLWNRAAEEITGVPASEALGRTPAQVLQRELESEGGGTNRLVAIPRGGGDVWLSLSEAVMRDPTGAVAGRIFAFRDISSERAVEQMKSDFVSTVSVELRTPLTSIYGFAQTLLRNDIAFGDEERRTFLEFIARESERLTTIVDALLNVARLDTGDLQVSLEPTDVAGIVGDVVASVQAAVNGDGHRFVADIEADDLEAQADPEKLRQVLDQLVSNAVKYSPDGGTVTVSARRRDGAVEVAVTDEGIGVAPSERERIFSKFYRAPDVHGPGTGLGLFIANGLVREMGGRMWVDENDDGRGSRFAFELPLASHDVSFRPAEA